VVPVTGQPESYNIVVTSKVQRTVLGLRGGHVTMRNNGKNFVWWSWTNEPEKFRELPCGTSHECDVDVTEIYTSTQTGQSILAVDFVPSV
jgi:hypothetical protein